MKVAAYGIALLLAGCASTVPAPVVIREPVEVRVPVLEPCISAVPAAPEFISDADLAALPDYPLVLALHRDRIQRIAFERVLLAALSRCSTLQPESTSDR